MKLLIASDIHGSLYYALQLEEIIKKEQPDKIILLGDLYYHGPANPLPKDYNPKKVAELLNRMRHRIEVVKGNCDAEVDEMISEFKFYRSITMNMGSHKIFFTHGHEYHIQNLPPQKASMVIYGHTHEGWIKEKNGIIFANPGSISLPRQEKEHSYLLLTDQVLMLKSLDGKTLETKHV